jgi:hypothetical protein
MSTLRARYLQRFLPESNRREDAPRDHVGDDASHLPEVRT